MNALFWLYDATISIYCYFIGHNWSDTNSYFEICERCMKIDMYTPKRLALELQWRKEMENMLKLFVEYKILETLKQNEIHKPNHSNLP